MKFITILLISLMAILSDHIMGSTLAVIIYDLPAEMFSSVITLYPIERGILALATSSIVFLVNIALQSTLMESENFRDDIEKAKMEDISSYVDQVKEIIKDDRK